MSFYSCEDDSDLQPDSGGEQDLTQFATDGESESDRELEFSEGDGTVDEPAVIGVLGEYLLLEPIGQGGMGQVYRAEHRTMNRQVALKVLGKRIAQRPGLREQFFAEIRAAGKLLHPHIVTAFDAGSQGNTHYLVMELVDGELLSARVRREGPLNTGEAVSVLVQAGRALAYAHKQGVIHRDIKPSNMMLTADGVLKILDFGLARLGVPSRAREDATKMLIGTPEFMSPEQIEDPEHVDARSDLYSLGATLFYLLTGQPMFRGKAMQVARAQLIQRPPPLFTLREDADLRLDAVYSKLTAKDPAERYASAQEMLEALEEFNLLSEPATASVLRKGAFRLASESPTSVAYNKSTLARKSRIIAIDLGLATTTAAYFDPDSGPQLICVGEGNTWHLRNMLWSRQDQVRVGQPAVAMRAREPQHMFHSVQRWIGMQQFAKPFGGRQAPPEVLLAAVLKQILHFASPLTDGSTAAVVTVPACYDQMHRRAIRIACRIAGIDLMQLLDKPLATGLSWLDIGRRVSDARADGSGNSAKTLLILHGGGSALEAAVVRLENDHARQIGVCGHWKFGVPRWQSQLAEYFSVELKRQTGKSIREDVAAATRLQRTVELTIARLASSRQVEVRFDWLNCKLRQMITQAGLLQIATGLETFLRQIMFRACKSGNIALADVDHVLLTGTLMHMHAVQEIVRSALPGHVPITKIDKTDVARGAAIQAGYLSALSSRSGSSIQGHGCTAYDIALLVASKQPGKAMPRVLLNKATCLPTSSSHTIQPEALGSRISPPEFQLIESSSLENDSWLKLGRVQPVDLFPRRPIQDPLRLQLDVDESGILESSLIWPGGNRQARVPASLEGELSDSEIQSWREWLESLLLSSPPASGASRP